MGRKKKKAARPAGDSRMEAVQPDTPDYSKYERAKSNKSTVNLALLKLARPEVSPGDNGGVPAEKAAEAGQKKSGKSGKKEDQRKKARKKTGRGEEEYNDGEWVESFSRNAVRSPDVAGAVEKAAKEFDAEKRFDEALGSGDHYSSVIEKFYLKHPDARKKGRASASRGTKRVRRRKRRPSVEPEERRRNERSVAEIAARNKVTPSAVERARGISYTRAKGVVPSRIAHRDIYRRKKKRSGALNVLIVAVMLVFICAVCTAVFFNVKSIRVTGESPYSMEAILSQCTFKKGDNIFLINTKTLEDTIMRELPYIEACTVGKSLPSTVTINVSGADLLGVAEIDGNTWTVLSNKGKVLETDTDLGNVSESDTLGRLTYTPEIHSAEELAEEKDIPVLHGINVKNHVKDGYTADDARTTAENFAVIKRAADKYDMKLTSITFDTVKGYDAVYDGRLRIFLGENLNQKMVNHRMHEVYALIFVEKYIPEDGRGEIKFYKQNVYFRPEYSITEEELQKLNEQRMESNRRNLMKIGEIFMTTGDEWFKGKLVTE